MLAPLMLSQVDMQREAVKNRGLCEGERDLLQGDRGQRAHHRPPFRDSETSPAVDIRRGTLTNMLAPLMLSQVSVPRRMSTAGLVSLSRKGGR